MADSLEGLTVIFPVSGNAAGLAAAFAPWQAVLSASNRPYEVFLVADGLTAELGDAIDAITQSNHRVKKLSLEKPTGFGACVRLGLAEATQPLVFYSSLEGGWNPADLPRMLKAIEFRDEYTNRLVELVNGHRRGLPEPSGLRWRRRVFGLGFRLLFGAWPDPGKGYLGPVESRYWYRARLQFGLRLGDVNSRFKLFRRSVVSRMEIQSDGEFVHTELLAKANFLGTLMDEIVLGDKCIPGDLPDMSADRKRVFSHPKFRSPEAPAAPVTPPDVAPASA